MVVLQLLAITEWDGLISALAGFVILATLVPLLCWVLLRISQIGGKVREDQRSESGMRELFRRRREPAAELDEAAISQLAGGYDSRVEELIRSQQLREALQYCLEHLADESLKFERRAVYARYVEQLQELLRREASLP